MTGTLLGIFAFSFFFFFSSSRRMNRKHHFEGAVVVRGCTHKRSLSPSVLCGKDGGHSRAQLGQLKVLIYRKTSNHLGRGSRRTSAVLSYLASTTFRLQGLESIVIWASLFKVFEFGFSFPLSIKVEIIMPSLKSLGRLSYVDALSDDVY